ncbi:N-acetyl-gamma-glutamyl-phosphate reductase [bioreactor metagenome]|uniref:N-acetyl-gamma-glutamyl-phosphate reductase n=1 Tax=bioreactor metagenome TaxID=1076179 RepID=A0A644Z257_9ZZZZ|nr:N-acetyl-gamma-glutamyl-phosphate reductase [Oscillospiraceae bacterium]
MNLKKKTIFIDGKEGTTGLRIYERLAARNGIDIELLTVEEAVRKDPENRRRLINASDIVFLCLPDDASRESVALCENPDTVIIDSSTAYRTDPSWAYGFPELSEHNKDNIKNGKRIAVPGCHASGFVSIVYPLVKEGIISTDERFDCFSLTGYSGGGRKMISQYESDMNKSNGMFSPRIYGLGQNHKHLKEMKAICGLSKNPLFLPIVDDYFSGMIVNVPLPDGISITKDELRVFYSEYYKNSRIISVSNENEHYSDGFIPANAFSGYDSMMICVTGSDNDDSRILISSIFDNLGKGASGAAVQCMNLSMGIDEAAGLKLI